MKRIVCIITLFTLIFTAFCSCGEKEEDDFKKLQALKTAKKEVDSSLDIVVSSKSSRKQKVDKKSIKKEPKTKEKNPEGQAQEILEES